MTVRRGPLVDVQRHVEHLFTDAGVVGVPRWSGQSSTAVELLPVTQETVACHSVGVRLVDDDLTVRALADDLAHLHECSETSCLQVWRHALGRANRRPGPRPDFSLFWWDRDGPESAILMHREDYEDCVTSVDRPGRGWTAMSLTSWNIADWRMTNGHRLS